jgi:uncharacterized membrane protein
MVQGMGHIDLRPGRLVRKISQNLKLNPNWQFARDIGRLIAEYRWYSLAILCVTFLQELSALWPVNLLGDFVDRLETGNLGNVVWLLMGASVLYPAIMRANIILRHKMFYETDFQKRVELTLEASSSTSEDAEAAAATNTRIANAVSGITNATYYVLGNFTPIIIKITVVFSNLMRYNRMLGIAYLVSLIVPSIMTVAFNNWLRVLRDAQYSIVSRADGTAAKFFSSQDKASVSGRFREVMAERKNILIALVSKHQVSLFVRQAALVGSQFLVVFLALAWRRQLGLTPGDFTKIVGYTTQVAAAFIETAACLDAIVSHSRAYHVYAQANKR